MTNNKPLLHILPLLLLLFVHKSSSQLYTLNLPEPVTETEVEIPIVTETDNSFPQAVIDVMSSREMRYHHFLWHNIRDNWNRFTADIQQQISSLGWEPPRPARAFEGLTIVALTDNDSGQDFFYMHRQMIAKFKDIVEQVGSGYDTSGWKTIPAPNDAEYPSEPYDIPGNSSVVATINQTKTDAFYNNQLVPMEETFEDADALRNMTLGQLGSRIENTIHNWMHLRFSTASSVGYRPSTTDAFPDIDSQWDNPEYTWLGDTYSSHVNPIFWKLHGWVDARINDWQTANGVQEIQWNGTWIGGPMETIMDLLQIPNLEAAILNIEDNEVSASSLEAQLNTINGITTNNAEMETTVFEPETFEPENIEMSTEDVVTLTANEMHNPSFSPSCSFADNIQVNFGPIGKVVAIGVSEPDPVSQPGVFSSTWGWKKAL